LLDVESAILNKMTF